MSGVLLAGCGSTTSYDAVEDGMREWLAAVANGDVEACTLETADVNDELLERYPELGSRGIDCAARVARMGTLDMPPSDSEMAVPVWDPSGEALVEITEAATSTVWSFWMVHDDDRWLVAGLSQ